MDPTYMGHPAMMVARSELWILEAICSIPIHGLIKKTRKAQRAISNQNIDVQYHTHQNTER
jgi:hypothetical protein